MLAALLPLISYFIVKKYSDTAVVMPRHYYAEDIKIDTSKGKQSIDTVWHQLADFKLVDPGVAQQALAGSSHEALVHLAHEYPKEGMEATSLESLEKMSSPQLAGMIDVADAHIRKVGPVAFGGYFYGITGFHGFHVFSGVIINIVMLMMAQKDVFHKRGHYLMIEKAGLYWHFVDLVWVFVFLCFYLI